MINRANLLGDVRAEADSIMLDAAFYETPDYRTIIESSDRSIVVGRRGTGKSATAYKLNGYWSKLQKTVVIQLAADEDQIIGIRPLIQLFGDSFKLLRAGSKIAWRYALLLEVADALSHKYKYKKADGADYLETHLVSWRRNQYGFSAKLKDCLAASIDKSETPENIIGGLAQKLKLKDVEDSLSKVLDDLNVSVYILVDRLDEGYEPDNTGIGLVDGLVHSIIDINTKYSNIRPLVFLRDNIYRAISRTDPDFTRDIEGQVLRLHWDEYALFTFATSRLNIAFSLNLENSLRIWNRCASRELEGKDGFKRCLRLTLYRPRDILILLNEAFRLASRTDRNQIVGEDIEATAKVISNNRLEDLHKEYLSMIPALNLFTSAFLNQNPEIQLKTIEPVLSHLLRSDSYDSAIQQQLSVLDSYIDVIRILYGI